MSTETGKQAQFLSLHEVAGMIGVTGNTILAWASKGEIPRPLKFGRSRNGILRWRRDEIDNWLADLASTRNEHTASGE